MYSTIDSRFLTACPILQPALSYHQTINKSCKKFDKTTQVREGTFMDVTCLSPPTVHSKLVKRTRGAHKNQTAAFI